MIRQSVEKYEWLRPRPTKFHMIALQSQAGRSLVLDTNSLLL